MKVSRVPEAGGVDKQDSGKPAARLLPIHAIPGLDKSAREFTKAIYLQDFEKALQMFPSLFGEHVHVAAQRALEYGVDKYGVEIDLDSIPNGYDRYRDALSRHTIAWFVDWKERDSESTLRHYDHIGANLLFLRHFQLTGGAK